MASFVEAILVIHAMPALSSLVLCTDYLHQDFGLAETVKRHLDIAGPLFCCLKIIAKKEKIMQLYIRDKAGEWKASEYHDYVSL